MRMLILMFMFLACVSCKNSSDSALKEQTQDGDTFGQAASNNLFEIVVQKDVFSNGQGAGIPDSMSIKEMYSLYIEKRSKLNDALDRVNRIIHQSGGNYKVNARIGLVGSSRMPLFNLKANVFSRSDAQRAERRRSSANKAQVLIVRADVWDAWYAKQMPNELRIKASYVYKPEKRSEDMNELKLKKENFHRLVSYVREDNIPYIDLTGKRRTTSVVAYYMNEDLKIFKTNPSAAVMPVNSTENPTTMEKIESAISLPASVAAHFASRKLEQDPKAFIKGSLGLVKFIQEIAVQLPKKY